MNEYAVNEIFYSLQGEGYYTGTAAIFIRFAACNLRCPFCDTDFSKGQRMSAESIVRACDELTRNKPLIVLTDGEPTLQVDAALCAALHEAGYKTIAMETNGTNPIPTGVDFVTCSPKCDFVNDYETIKEADEVKIIFDGVVDTPLVEPLDCAVGHFPAPFKGLEAIGHPAEADYLAGVQFAGDGLAYLAGVCDCGLGWIPHTPEVQQGAGVAVAAVVLASAAVGIQPGRVVASLGFVSLHGGKE